MVDSSDSGYGPPKGSIGDTSAPQIPMKDLADLAQRQLGYVDPPTNDPAFQPPGNPMAPIKPGDKDNRKTAIIYRDIAITNVAVRWRMDQARNALAAHMTGIFTGSSQLYEAILGDPRVQATLGSRLAALFGREVRFKPANDSRAAKEVCDAWQEDWPALCQDNVQQQMQAWAVGMAFSHAQIVWDKTAARLRPQLRFWNSRYTYYHYELRRYIALTKDGQRAINPGDGKWVQHTPFGAYRGWIHAAVLAITEPWIIRHYAITDWARFSEVHGMPIRKAIVPAAAPQPARDAFQAQLAKLGPETTIMVAHGVDGYGLDYDLELVEAMDKAWESFPGLRDHCDMDITLAMLFQNLTTEVKGGSFAATKSHMDVRQSGTETDNESWKHTLHDQVASCYAYLNYGDASLAPWTDRDVTPKADYAANSAALAALGSAIQAMAAGGFQFKNPDELAVFAEKALGLKGLPTLSMLALEVMQQSKAGQAESQDKAKGFGR